MNYKSILPVIFFAISLNANERVSDIFFYPEANQSIGFTSLKISNSELSATISGTKITLSSSKTLLQQMFAMGFQSGFGVGISLDYLQNGSSDLKVGSASTSTDYDKKIQAPRLQLGKRFEIESSGLKFVDTILLVTPKGSSDDANSSDYIGLQVAAGTVLSDTVKATGTLGYVSYNSTDTLEASNLSVLQIAAQSDLNESSFLQGSIAYTKESDSEFKSSTTKISSDPYMSFKLAFGITKVGTNLDWLFSYSTSNLKIKYYTSGVGYSGDGSGNSLSLGLGYKF